MFQECEKFFGNKLDEANVERLSESAKNFLKSYEKILGAANPSPMESVHPGIALKILLREHSLYVDPKFYESLGSNDNFEAWTFDHKFLGSGLQLFRKISFSWEDLINNDWANLFDRDIFSSKKILEAWNRIYRGEPYVKDVTGYHLVSERNETGNSAYVCVKEMWLLSDLKSDADAGIVAITSIRDYATL